MIAKITQEDMENAQRLIRQTLLISGDISEIEERLARIKKENLDLYKKLDNIADGENQG